MGPSTTLFMPVNGLIARSQRGSGNAEALPQTVDE